MGGENFRGKTPTKGAAMLFNLKDDPYEKKNLRNTGIPNLTRTKGVRADLAAYYDEIHRLDSDFGEIMEYLDRNGQRENTIVTLFYNWE